MFVRTAGTQSFSHRSRKKGGSRQVEKQGRVNYTKTADRWVREGGIQLTPNQAEEGKLGVFGRKGKWFSRKRAKIPFENPRRRTRRWLKLVFYFETLKRRRGSFLETRSHCRGDGEPGHQPRYKKRAIVLLKRPGGEEIGPGGWLGRGVGTQGPLLAAVGGRAQRRNVTLRDGEDSDFYTIEARKGDINTAMGGRDPGPLGGGPAKKRKDAQF